MAKNDKNNKRQKLPETDGLSVPPAKRTKLLVHSEEQPSTSTHQNNRKGKQVKNLPKRNLIREKNSLNNNAIPTKNTEVVKENEKIKKKAVTPIIQTRGMKNRSRSKLMLPQVQTDFEEEMQRLNAIDKLNPVEIADGNLSEEVSDDMVNHDGVVLSVQGSDIEEFPDGEPAANQPESDNSSNENVTETEHGEISSDKETEAGRAARKQPKIASKIVVVPRERKDNQDRQHVNGSANKYSHLRNDPEFRVFLDEMLDSCMAARGSPAIKEVDNTANTTPHHDKDSRARRASKNLVSPFKSSSDTTIYTPGLRKASLHNEELSLVDKISDFVENIRIDTKRKRHRTLVSSPVSDSRWVEKTDHTNRESRSPVRSTPHLAQHDNSEITGGESSTGNRSASYRRSRSRSNSPDPEVVADQLLLQAEKFKARVEAPKGKYSDFLMPYEKLRDKFVKPDGLAPLDIISP